jgi:hypothetical protein
VREHATVHYPFKTLSLLNLKTRFCFMGRAVTPHIFNLQDYVNHMFERAKSSMELKIRI